MRAGGTSLFGEEALRYSCSHSPNIQPGGRARSASCAKPEIHAPVLEWQSTVPPPKSTLIAGIREIGPTPLFERLF
jgi:hypothetical protein